ncbi:MAG: aminotransferase class III-fold pyridoxal phosphate-dependent enzyme [Deinococcales bacterium]
MAGGAGVYLYDDTGRRYLDFSAQFSSAAVGHAHPEMIEALTQELRTGVGITSEYVTEVRARLADRLCDLMPDGLDACLFGVTGADAIEYALKVAKIIKGGGAILGLQRSYHGATAGAAAATGKSETIQRNRAIKELLPSGFLHFSPPYCYRCDFGQAYPDCSLLCLQYVKRQIKHFGAENVAAFIVEPVIAGGGVIVPPEGYLQDLVEFCHSEGILVIFDEVVTGFGRTGSMFAFEQAGVVPDLVVVGKALTGGYIPGSGVVVRRDHKEELDQFHLHGHTHSGYPLMCRAALTLIDLVERDSLVAHAQRVGNYLGEQLSGLKREHPSVGDVRGVGLLWGIEIVQAGTMEPDFEGASRLCDLLLEEGLVVEPEIDAGLGTSILVVHPPLILEEEHVDLALSMMSEALMKLEGRS